MKNTTKIVSMNWSRNIKPGQRRVAIKDHSNKVPLRINDKTTIMVDADANMEEIRQRYLNHKP